MRTLARLSLTALCIGMIAVQVVAERNPTAGTSAPAKPVKEPVPITLSTISPDGRQVVYAKVFGDIDKPPIPMFQAVAAYPADLMAKGVQGAAVVKFTLTAKGEAKDFSVQSDQDEFGSAALAAAKRNKHKPAEKAGKRVECKMELLYTFPGPFVIGRTTQ